MTYKEEVNLLIKAALKSEKDSKKVQEILLNDFKYYGKHTKLIFNYVYCDRPENRLRQRVGKNAGYRYGTISFQFIPDNKIPRSRKPEDGATRYYDFGRANWRSYRNNCLIQITAFWDEKNETFVSSPEEAGIKRNKRDQNYRYKFIDRPDTSEEKAKRKKVAKKEAEQYKKDISRNAFKKGLDYPTDVGEIDLLLIRKQSIYNKII